MATEVMALPKLAVEPANSGMALPDQMGEVGPGAAAGGKSKVLLVMRAEVEEADGLGDINAGVAVNIAVHAEPGVAGEVESEVGDGGEIGLAVLVDEDPPAAIAGDGGSFEGGGNGGAHDVVSKARRFDWGCRNR